jgi:hypothetical protein
LASAQVGCCRAQSGRRSRRSGVIGCRSLTRDRLGPLAPVGDPGYSHWLRRNTRNRVVISTAIRASTIG